jgi:uncharacterized membrane protein (UPF0127 family)
MRSFLPLLLAAVLWCGCGPSPNACPDVLNTRTVTLPGGQKICAEVEVTQVEMRKGMMFRDSLPQGHGMLFMHDSPGLYPYWMFQCKIPLDMIWMDPQHHIVEISHDTPPCFETADKCPSYGGHEQAQYVLELGGGEAKRLGLRNGQSLEF